jgi:hypothetical protein
MQGIEWEGPEEAFRRGYEHGAIETLHAVSRFLVPAAREILRTWVRTTSTYGGTIRCAAIPRLGD